MMIACCLQECESVLKLCECDMEGWNLLTKIIVLPVCKSTLRKPQHFSKIKPLVKRPDTQTTLDDDQNELVIFRDKDFS